MQIPPKLLQHLDFSLRTGWALLVTLLLQYYYPWSPIVSYVSPVIAIICPAKWFGVWQENVIKVGYSSIIGSIIGIGVGTCPTKETIIITLFFGMLFMNCISSWDRLTKVIGTLSLVTSALIPSITNGLITPFLSCKYVLIMLNIPSAIWGFTLLFPFPSFAFLKSQPKILTASKKLSQMISSLIKAFLSYDSVDLCCADYDQLALELRAEIDVLKLLQKYSANEALIFPHISKVPNYLLLYIKTMESIILDLDVLRDSVKNIIYNNTQLYFVHKLERYLLSINDEMELILTIIAEYLTLFPLIRLPSALKRNSIVTNGSVRLIESMKKERLTKEVEENKDQLSAVPANDSESDPRSVFHYSFKAAFEEHAKLIDKEKSYCASSLSFLEQLILSEPHLTEEECLKIYLHREFQEGLKHLLFLRENLFTTYNLVRKKYIGLPQLSVAKSSSRKSEFDPAAPLLEMDPSILINDDLLCKTLQEESQRFSLRNFGSRCSYLHELSIVIEHVVCLSTMFETDITNQPKSNYDFLQILKNIFTVVFLYLRATWNFTYELCYEIFKSVLVLKSFLFTRQVEHRATLHDLIRFYFSRYIQPFKLSLIVAMAGIIPIYDVFPTFLQKGVWVTFVTVLIRQDNLSSSFQTSYQRLEGTVIGSIYAFIVYELFTCNENFTNSLCIHQIYMQIIFLVGWSTFCCLFREGEHHGYSATVAGFTPFILLLNPSTTGQNGTFSRIEETFIGIGIYLMIDFCIFPRRMYPLVKQSTLKCIKMMREVIHDNVSTVEKMGRYETIKFQPPTSELLRLHRHRVSDARFPPHSPRRKNSLSIGSNDEIISIDSMNLYHLFDYDQNNTLSGKFTQEEVGGDIELGQPVVYITPIPSNSMKQFLIGTRHSSQPIEYDVRELTTSIDPSDQNIVTIYDECKQSINAAEIKLHSLRDELIKQSFNLKAILFEPNLFFYSFPWSSYDQLYQKFHNVYRSSYALNNSSKSLMIVICQMMEKEESISAYLQHLSFLIKHVLIVTHKSDEALSLTYEAFQTIYESHDFGVDLQSLLTLRRSCDRLLHSVDDHFRNVYLHNSSEAFTNFNPYFLVALLSLFECMIQLIHSLSELGMALHIVRNVEAYQYKP